MTPLVGGNKRSSRAAKCSATWCAARSKRLQKNPKEPYRILKNPIIACEDKKFLVGLRRSPYEGLGIPRTSQEFLAILSEPLAGEVRERKPSSIILA